LYLGVQIHLGWVIVMAARREDPNEQQQQTYVDCRPHKRMTPPDAGPTECGVMLRGTTPRPMSAVGHILIRWRILEDSLARPA
jgi:hypothetical protein